MTEFRSVEEQLQEVLRDIEPQQLGRLMNNRQSGGKRRAGTKHDLRIGRLMMAPHSTIQEVLDEWGRSVRISRVLHSIPNDDWLPKFTDTLYVIDQKESPTRTLEAPGSCRPYSLSDNLESAHG